MTGFLFASVSAGHGALLGLVGFVCLAVAMHFVAGGFERRLDAVVACSGERECSVWDCTRPGRRRWNGSRRCVEHMGTEVAA